MTNYNCLFCHFIGGPNKSYQPDYITSCKIRIFSIFLSNRWWLPRHRTVNVIQIQHNWNDINQQIVLLPKIFSVRTPLGEFSRYITDKNIIFREKILGWKTEMWHLRCLVLRWVSGLSFFESWIWVANVTYWHTPRDWFLLCPVGRMVLRLENKKVLIKPQRAWLVGGSEYPNDVGGIILVRPYSSLQKAIKK